MSDTLYEFYDVAPDDTRGITSLTFRAQTFTLGTVGANTAHKITSIKAKLQDTNHIGAGTLTVGIYATSAGKPTGSALATGTKAISTISTGTPTLYEILISSCPLLSVSTMYAMVFSTDQATGLDLSGKTSGAYSGGTRVDSTDSGMNWTITSTEDYIFYEYGISTVDLSLTIPTATINILATSITNSVSYIIPTAMINLAASFSTNVSNKWNNLVKSSVSSVGNLTKNIANSVNQAKSTVSNFINRTKN